MLDDYGVTGLDVALFLDRNEVNRLGLEPAEGMFADEDAEEPVVNFTSRAGVVRTNNFIRGMAEMESKDD
jgi:hypothetical protein